MGGCEAIEEVVMLDIESTLLARCRQCRASGGKEGPQAVSLPLAAAAC